jgi:hypothetical protein
MGSNCRHYPLFHTLEEKITWYIIISSVNYLYHNYEITEIIISKLSLFMINTIFFDRWDFTFVLQRK